MSTAQQPLPLNQREPVALTIAGSDSSGGAGIQADLKTFTVLAVYGATVLTALTAQNTVGVQGVQLVPSGFVTEQMDSCFADLNVRAVKTGMRASTEIVAAVADRLAEEAVALVVDPVMVATSGDPLLTPDAVATYKSRLIPRADIVTPNLHEAARLLDTAPARTVEEMRAQAEALRSLGCRYVLVKGGHGVGDEAIDVLAGPGGIRLLSSPRYSSRNTHGTGCTLSAAIAGHLAKGLEMDAAVDAAKAFIAQAIMAGAGRNVGAGHGPVDHLFRLR